MIAQLDDDAESFLEYFEKTWIGERKRRGKDLRSHETFNELSLIQEMDGKNRSSIINCGTFMIVSSEIFPDPTTRSKDGTMRLPIESRLLILQWRNLVKKFVASSRNSKLISLKFFKVINRSQKELAIGNSTSAFHVLFLITIRLKSISI